MSLERSGERSAAHARLSAERAELLEQLSAIGLVAAPVDAGRQSADDALEDCAMDLDALRRESVVARLRRIDRALERIAVGTFGVCEACARPIGHRRLAADVGCSLCVVCQSQSEAALRTPSL